MTNGPYHYEDFEPGMFFHLGSHTFDASQLTRFADICGDQNPIHFDEAFMRQHPMKRPIVHGHLLGATASGLVSNLGLTRGTILAMLETTLSFQRPVFVQETVQGVMKVIDKRPTKNPMRGIVTYEIELKKDDGTVAMMSRTSIMVFTRKRNGDN